MSHHPDFLHFLASLSTTSPLPGTTFMIMSGQSPPKSCFPAQPKTTSCHFSTLVLLVIVYSVLPALVFLDQDHQQKVTYTLTNYIMNNLSIYLFIYLSTYFTTLYFLKSLTYLFIYLFKYLITQLFTLFIYISTFLFTFYYYSLFILFTFYPT